MNYITAFQKSRSTKIGSSDVPALIQHPEKSESLAGYGRTALTVYEEKIGIREREPAGFPAHMGHVVEPYAIQEFIRRHTDDKTADKFLRGCLLCDLDRTKDGYPTATATQTTDFLHHTEAVTDYSVSHADCINISDSQNAILIEAKTSGFWPARRTDDPYKGYDKEVKGHQGIPLHVFYQVQHQAAIYQEVYGVKTKVANLVLISEGQYYEWEIRIDTKIQERLLELCSYMKTCIDKKIPPKKLAMNVSDIKVMYPVLNEDFRLVSGEELTSAVEAAKKAKEAAEQLKAWKQKKEDAEAALSILLQDNKKLQGIIDGEITDIVAWQSREGGERILGLKDLKALDSGERLYKYMKKNGLIKVGEDSRFVKVKLKEV
jgi:hypothetical protein